MRCGCGSGSERQGDGHFTGMAGAQRAVPARGVTARRCAPASFGAQLQGQILRLDWAGLEGELRGGTQGNKYFQDREPVRAPECHFNLELIITTGCV